MWGSASGLPSSPLRMHSLYEGEESMLIKHLDDNNLNLFLNPLRCGLEYGVILINWNKWSEIRKTYCRKLKSRWSKQMQNIEWWITVGSNNAKDEWGIVEGHKRSMSTPWCGFKKKQMLFWNTFIGLSISDVTARPPLRPEVIYSLFDSALRKNSGNLENRTATMEYLEKLAKWGLVNPRKGEEKNKHNFSNR